MFVSRRKAVWLLSTLPFATLCGCQADRPRISGDYGPIKRARSVHFSHQFNTQLGGDQCAVSVRPTGAGAVRLDFATLGLVLRKDSLQQSQMLAGNLPLQILSPVRSIGFTNRLRFQIHKPIGFSITVSAVLAGAYHRLDLNHDEEITHQILTRELCSLMPWPANPNWQHPPPFSLAIELVVKRETGLGSPVVIAESLDIQAIEV